MIGMAPSDTQLSIKRCCGDDTSRLQGSHTQGSSADETNLEESDSSEAALKVDALEHLWI